MIQEFNIKEWTKWYLIEDKDKNLTAPCQICMGKIREHKALSFNTIRCMGCGVKKCII